MLNYKEAVENLDLPQFTAYQNDNNLVICAGPGSGKTRVLTLKLAKTLDKLVNPPQKVACLTYSNEAVREINYRLKKLYFKNRLNKYVGTLHAFCLTQILYPYYKICRPSKLPIDFKIANKEQINFAYNNVIEPDIRKETSLQVLNKFRSKYFKTWLKFRDSDGHKLLTYSLEYEEELYKLNCIDFSDIISFSLDIVTNNRWVIDSLNAKFPVIFVDEYQDLGGALHELINQLCFIGNSKIIAVGDSSQSIYGFQGARPELLDELSKRDEMNFRLLYKNYRSRKNFVKHAGMIIKNNHDYIANQKEEGEISIIKCSEGIHSQFKYIKDCILTDEDIRLHEVAILFPSRKIGTELEKYLRANQIPNVSVDLYPKCKITRLIEDIAKLLDSNFRHNFLLFSEISNTFIDLVSIIELSSKKRFEIRQRLYLFMQKNQDLKVVKWCEVFMIEFEKEFINLQSYYPDEYEYFNNFSNVFKRSQYSSFRIKELIKLTENENSINIMTIHASKGKEYKVVIMVGMDDGNLPWWKQDFEEAKRLFYVGFTRAEEKIYILYSGFTTNKYGRKFYDGPSPFINDIDIEHSSYLG